VAEWEKSTHSTRQHTACNRPRFTTVFQLQPRSILLCTYSFFRSFFWLLVFTTGSDNPIKMEKQVYKSNRRLSTDSIDWGSMRSLGKQVSDDADIASRYDPKFIRRIMSSGDIDDDSSCSSITEVAGNDGNKKRNQACRETIRIVSLVGIIIAASLAIGYAVVNYDPSERPYAVVEHGISEQSLLEIAERVVTVCSERSLDKDMSECQELCHTKMCCFESGEYSCEDDDSKTCAAYAGCEALIEGTPLNAEEEVEE